MVRHPILYVENDPNDVFLVRRALREAMVFSPVQVVEDGTRAVAYLQGKGEFSDRCRYPLPSLIFLDMSMPKMNGTEFLAWIRGQPKLKRIPVIVFSSSGDERDVSASYELGASSYMVKPVSFGELVEQIKAFKTFWLERSVLPEFPATPASETEQQIL